MIIEGGNGETINTHDPDRGQPIVEVTFHNVTITIAAKDEQAAYDRLAELLNPACAANELEYTTDTYSVGNEKEYRSTEELFG